MSKSVLSQLVNWISLLAVYAKGLKYKVLGSKGQAQRFSETEVPALSHTDGKPVSLDTDNNGEGVMTESDQEKDIPFDIDDSERIVRTLYDPIHFRILKAKKPSDVQQHILKFKAYEPPVNLDEVSVTRLEYSSADFCKVFGRSKESPDPAKRRKYYGLGVILVREIKAAKAKIKYTANYTDENYNPAHSDIYFGIVREKDKPVSGELQLMMDQLTDITRVYKDNDISADVWNSGDLM